MNGLLRTRLRYACSTILLAASTASPALADDLPLPDTEAKPTTPPHEAKSEAPITAYAYTAHGAHAGTYGAQAYGSGLTASGQKPTAGGGILAWSAPVDRLTLVVDAPRDVYLEGHFAPSAGAIVRIAGTPGKGFVFGGLARYKVEGFGTDPNGDIECEVEGGLLLSYAGGGAHLDLNTITGFGLTEEGDIDTEMRLRFGYDAARFVRIGLDGQGRYRLAGSKKLLNGAVYDFAGGPQVVVGAGQFFGAFTAGPTTMGTSTSGVVGGTAIVSTCAMM